MEHHALPRGRRWCRFPVKRRARTRCPCATPRATCPVNTWSDRRLLAFFLTRMTRCNTSHDETGKRQINVRIICEVFIRFTNQQAISRVRRNKKEKRWTWASTIIFFLTLYSVTFEAAEEARLTHLAFSVGRYTPLTVGYVHESASTQTRCSFRGYLYAMASAAQTCTLGICRQNEQFAGSSST